MNNVSAAESWNISKLHLISKEFDVKLKNKEHAAAKGVFFLIFRPTLFFESNRIKRINLRIVTNESESYGEKAEREL